MQWVKRDKSYTFDEESRSQEYLAGFAFKSEHEENPNNLMS